MLEVKHLSKSFGPTPALRDVSFSLPTGQVLAVIGPSGCGKSTLLSLIAGLMEPDAGEMFWNGQSLNATPTHQRGFGLMFQDYALFPHLNVGDNVAFGLKSNNKAEVVAETLEKVGLAGFALRDVQTLSGGEQQRVALARALAPRPRLLMLDEPLGALDRALREQLTVELRSLLNDYKQTAIYVTHDQQEAFGIADLMLVLRAGQVQQTGTPEDIYTAPANDFVREFLGPGQLVKGLVEASPEGRPMVRTAFGLWPLPPGPASARPGTEVTLLLRAEGLRKR